MPKKPPYILYETRLKTYARENRKQPNSPEHKLWREVLSRKQLRGYKFTRQKPIGCYILDFYCSKLLLDIEVDGDSHAGQAKYDQQRTRYLQTKGLKTVRYPNKEVMQNLEGVYADLIRQVEQRERELGLLPRESV